MSALKEVVVDDMVSEVEGNQEKSVLRERMGSQSSLSGMSCSLV